MAKIITSLDLWTETDPNSEECAVGAFVDGWKEGVPYRHVKLIKNCNCIIKSNDGRLFASNKHSAIVFSGGGQLRLCVMTAGTDILKMEERAMAEPFQGRVLQDILKHNGVTRSVVDLGEKPVNNGIKKNIDIASCDRISLLKCFLNGSFTEDDTGIGSGLTRRYIYLPQASMEYSLRTDTDWFMIGHRGAFISDDGQSAIPIQKYGSITRKNLEPFIEQIEQ